MKGHLDVIKRQRGRLRLILIGASAGGIETLQVLLKELPASFRIPIAVVLHLPPERPSLLVEVFAPLVGFKVQEVSEKEALAPGTLYFAAPDYHLLFEKDGTFALSSEEPVQYSRPSIDVAFESAADAYRESLLGVILTGANEDGAAGLAEVVRRGGFAVVQAPASAVMPMMPEAALKSVPHAVPLEPRAIAELLRALDSG